MLYDAFLLLIIVLVSIAITWVAKRYYYQDLDWHESFGLFLICFVLVGIFKTALDSYGSLFKNMVGLVSVSGALFLMAFVGKLAQKTETWS